MVFSSLIFLFRFLPAVLLAYYIVPRPLQNFVLLLFSLIFYGWGEPVYILLMLVSILISYTGGCLIGRFRQRGEDRLAKAALAISTAVSLSLLIFFKYADFGIKTADRFLGMNLATLNLALPIGISFYTFQTISYMVDVYRGEAAVQKNLISFGAYVTMFPQLIAGPIVPYKAIAAQLRDHRGSVEAFAEGVRRFVLGLGKKVLLANHAGALWDTVQALPGSEAAVLTAWMGLAAYTFQIYFDFSAYSDMAIGLGKMFGFYFPENFKDPYTARSITEFWRRWHMSLGSWFREYVYIPLGGNRVSAGRHIRNILIVWMLTGIWHGASWNFVLWGLYYGILLLLEKYIWGTYLERLPRFLPHLYCMALVMLGWNLFMFEDMRKGIAFAGLLLGIKGGGAVNRQTAYLLYNNGLLLVFCILGSTRLPKRVGKWLCTRLEDRELLSALLQGAAVAGIFLLSVSWLVDATYNPFLYFRF